MKAWFLISLFFCCGTTLFSEEGYRFPIGETIKYSVRWGVIRCGTVTIKCDEVEFDEGPLIRVQVHAKSNWLASRIYPTDDTVSCYIHPKTHQSVRLEKYTSEGDYICKDILTFDREANRAYWESHSANITTNYAIYQDTLDAVSFLYAFRERTFQTGESEEYKLAVDDLLHSITITAGDCSTKSFDGLGCIRSRKFYTVSNTEGLFVRKIPKAIWISDDERKIMTKMTLELPIGESTILLDEYVPPATP